MEHITWSEGFSQINHKKIRNFLNQAIGPDSKWSLWLNVGECKFDVQDSVLIAFTPSYDALITLQQPFQIDEPSAYLDSEQRLVAAKVIKRFILHAKKTGFVVEHDFIMAT